MREIIDHDFVARGEYFQEKSSIPVIIRGTYSEFEHKPVKCIVIPDTAEQNFQPILNEHNLGQLRGIAQDGEDVWISELVFISSSHFSSKNKSYWEGTAENFIKGNLEEFDATNGEIYCELFIPPTPLAQSYGYHLHFDGTISVDNPTLERKRISWKTKYGDAELIDGYYYADQQIGIDSGTVQVQRCQVSFKTRLNNSISLMDVLKNCAETFDDTLWLLSLLSRKRLTYYSGTALFVPDKDSKTTFRKAIIHRNRHLGYENSMGHGEHEFDLLIHPDKLKTNLFQNLLTNYSNSKYHDAIYRAIMYVLMSYERAYFEAYIGVIYLALETLVAGLSSDKDNSVNKVLEQSSFKTLISQLSQIVRKEVKSSKDADVLTRNLERINYIESSSFADRLLSLLKQHKVPLEKLWVQGVDVEAKLREIIRRRNLYIHKGEIGDYDQYLYDFARLRTLVELWILKLLDSPDDAITIGSLSNLAPIDN